MKKIFIAISVLAALTFCMVPAQANMGLPDDVPGSDAVVPFLVSMPGFGDINTLVVFTDVRGYGAPNGWNFHYTVYTVKSDTVYNDNLPGTDYDIVSTDAYTILWDLLMQPSQRARLEVDLDGDGVNDHWAGYIYFDLFVANQTNIQGKRNQMIGQTLLLNLPGGQAAAANTWFKEYANWGMGVMVDGNGMELWSANSLALSEQLQAGLAPVAPEAFGLYPRIYVNDANTGETCLFIWKSENWPLIPYLHVLIYDDEENPFSGNIPLPNELNILCLDTLGLLPAWPYPKQGWIALEVPDINGNGFVGFEDMDWAGYTWSYATGPAAESWSYLTQIHRDVSWRGNWDWLGW